MKDNKQKVETKKVSAKNKKPNLFVRIGKKFKEVFSEIKKVSWPTFAKVVKQTGIVLGVVACFVVVITLFDLGLEALLKLLTQISG